MYIFTIPNSIYTFIEFFLWISGLLGIITVGEATPNPRCSVEVSAYPRN